MQGASNSKIQTHFPYKHEYFKRNMDIQNTNGNNTVYNRGKCQKSKTEKIIVRWGWTKAGVLGQCSIIQEISMCIKTRRSKCDKKTRA